MHYKKILSLFLIMLLASCSKSSSADNAFYHATYLMSDVGTIDNSDILKGNNLKDCTNFISYKTMFDTKKSICTFSTYISDKNEPNGLASIQIVFKDGTFFDSLFDYNGTSNLYYGNLSLQNKTLNSESIELEISKIYVYNPYWIRFQFQYPIDGILTLLTAQYWISSYTEIPDFFL